MSKKSKLVLTLVVLAAVFSGNAKKLLALASQAIESEAMAEGGERGATCG